MINHLSLGVRELARSRGFYDAVLKPLGWKPQYEDDVTVGYGPDRPVLWILGNSEPPPPSPNSGLHICFDAADRRAVAAFHAAALANGGSDNGKPGPRADYGPAYFAAFVVDPDGYRIEAVCDRPDA